MKQKFLGMVLIMLIPFYGFGQTYLFYKIEKDIIYRNYNYKYLDTNQTGIIIITDFEIIIIKDNNDIIKLNKNKIKYHIIEFEMIIIWGIKNDSTITKYKI